MILIVLCSRRIEDFLTFTCTMLLTVQKYIKLIISHHIPLKFLPRIYIRVTTVTIIITRGNLYIMVIRHKCTILIRRYRFQYTPMRKRIPILKYVMLKRHLNSNYREIGVPGIKIPHRER